MANIINGTDTGSGGLITTGDSSDELQLQTAETARVTLTNTAVVVNEGGNDVDFRVEGDTNANLLFVDASADAVGIGTDSPFSSASQTSLSISGSAVSRVDFYNGATHVSNIDVYSGGGTGLVFRNITNLPMVFATNNTERLRVLAGGGLTFNGDTAAANALDDYEEGTWTPVITTLTGTVTYGSSRFGEYRKIGSAVFVEVNVTFTCSTGGAYILTCSLPFTASYATASVFPAMAVAGFYNIDLSAGGTAVEAYTTNGSATCNFHASGDNVTQGSLLTNSNTALTMEIRFSGVFFAS